jgi:hypothetical protein
MEIRCKDTLILDASAVSSKGRSLARVWRHGGIGERFRKRELAEQQSIHVSFETPLLVFSGIRTKHIRCSFLLITSIPKLSSHQQSLKGYLHSIDMPIPSLTEWDPQIIVTPPPPDGTTQLPTEPTFTDHRTGESPCYSDHM